MAWLIFDVYTGKYLVLAMSTLNINSLDNKQHENKHIETTLEMSMLLRSVLFYVAKGTTTTISHFNAYIILDWLLLCLTKILNIQYNTRKLRFSKSIHVFILSRSKSASGV